MPDSPSRQPAAASYRRGLVLVARAPRPDVFPSKKVVIIDIIRLGWEPWGVLVVVAGRGTGGTRAGVHL